jgi:hypothetical protein
MTREHFPFSRPQGKYGSSDPSRPGDCLKMVEGLCRGKGTRGMLANTGQSVTHGMHIQGVNQVVSFDRVEAQNHASQIYMHMHK